MKNDKRWQISAEQKAEIVAATYAIATGDDIPCAIRAIRLLIAMEAQNARDERGIDQPDETSNRFAGLIEKIRQEQSEN